MRRRPCDDRTIIHAPPRVVHDGAALVDPAGVKVCQHLARGSSGRRLRLLLGQGPGAEVEGEAAGVGGDGGADGQDLALVGLEAVTCTCTGGKGARVY